MNDKERCIQRIDHLSSLKDGWYDGEGYAPLPDALSAARVMLDKTEDMASIYHIYPTFAGGVLFEFDLGGMSWSVELPPEGEAEISGVGPDNREVDAVLPHPADTTFEPAFRNIIRSSDTLIM